MKALWGEFGGWCFILTLKLDFRLENGKSFFKHFFVVSLSFGIYQLERNLFDKIYETFLQLKEDLQMEHILITSNISFYIFQERSRHLNQNIVMNV